MEICSKDPHLDKLYSEISFKKDENIVRFFKRSFKECCKKLIEPSRLKYDTTDLNDSILNYKSFEVKEFSIVSKGLNLHCALWKNNTLQQNETTFESSTILEEDKKPCLIYLHTNTRSLIDAIEVLPLADKAGCHILSFDFPGAGHSEGSLSGSCSAVISHIEEIIKWAAMNLECSDVILWSRGMSTAAAIEYTSLVHNDPNSNIIKFLVLDSPYASVKQVVDTVLSKFHEKVTYNLGDIYMCVLGKPLSYACSWMFGKEVTSKLGGNMYAIQPIKYATKEIKHPI